MEQKKINQIVTLVSAAVIVICLVVVAVVVFNNSITMSEYNKIEYGMTYEEVVEIIGCEGEYGAGASVGSYSSEVYTWKGLLYYLNGANASISFSNGRVSATAQVGLIG